LAEEKLKEVMAKEFPQEYRKLFLEPFEGSELYEENLRRLEGGGGKAERRRVRRNVKFVGSDE